MKNILLLFLIALVFSCGGNSTAESDNREEASASPEQERTVEASNPSYESFPVPVHTTFSSLEGIFKKQNDTTYVINFWATWCKPCVKELPYFEKLTETYRNDKVRVILVSLDFPKDLERKLIPFLEKWDLQSEVAVLIDSRQQEWIDKVDPSWGGAIPATLVYRSGERTFLEGSFENYEQLDEMLRSHM